MGAGLAYQPLAAEALAQRWRDLSARPGLPDRWELDEYGGRIRWFDANGERADSAFGLKLTLPAQVIH